MAAYRGKTRHRDREENPKVRWQAAGGRMANYGIGVYSQVRCRFFGSGRRPKKDQRPDRSVTPLGPDSPVVDSAALVHGTP